MCIKQVIGLDRGRDYARVIELRRRGNSVSIVETDKVRMSHQSDEAQAVQERFLEQKGWRHIPCVIGLADEGAVLRLLELPRDDFRGAHQVVGTEIARFAELSDDELYHDYCVARHWDGSRSIMLALARKEAVETALRFRDELEIVGLVPDALALYICMTYILPEGKCPFAAVCVGNEDTRVVFGGRDGVLMNRRFFIGIRHLHAFLQRRQQETSVAQPFENHETVVKDLGDEQQAVSTFAEWLDEIKACLSFYHVQFPRPSWSLNCLIMADNGNLPDDWVSQRMASATNLPVYWQHDLAAQKGLEQTRTYALALGLALSMGTRRRIRINLLPPAEKEALGWKRTWKTWITCAAMAVLCVLAAVAQIGLDIRHQRLELQHLHEKINELQTMQRELTGYMQANTALEKHIAMMHDSGKNGLLIRALLSVLTQAKYKDDWIILVADTYTYFNLLTYHTIFAEPFVSIDREHLHPDGFVEIVIEGYTPFDDLSTVREMIQNLRACPFIENADLLADDQVRVAPERDQRWATTSCHLFALEIKMRKP